MAARIGIELGPVACRILELDTPGLFDRPGSKTCVRSFGSYVRPGRDLREALEELRGRTVMLVAWGLSAEHGQALVARAPYDQMRAEALARQHPDVNPHARSWLADIAPAGAPGPDAAERPVVLVSAPVDRVAAAVRPFTACGVHVRSIMTPAAALMSLARRYSGSAPGALDVYLALAETTTAIALIRDGALLLAHETDWGYLDPNRGLLVRPRAEMAAHVASYLEAFFKSVRSPYGAVATVYICGGMPDLRTMSIALINLLDVEVEPLDGFFGIDTTRLPDDGLDLRERTADIRLAWAAASDWPVPIDFLRSRRQRQQHAWIARAAVVAGMASGLGLGLAVESTGLGLSAIAASRAPAASLPPAAGRRARNTEARNTEVRNTEARNTEVRNTGVRDAGVRELPVDDARVAESVTQAPSAPVPEPAVGPEPRHEPADPPIVAADFARSYEPPPDIVFAAPAAPSPQAPPVVPGLVPPAASPRPVVVYAPAPPAAPPFSAELQTILYGPDRKLAVIDGRILEVGDEIRGARLVQITATAVVVREPGGRETRLHVGQTR